MRHVRLVLPAAALLAACTSGAPPSPDAQAANSARTGPAAATSTRPMPMLAPGITPEELRARVAQFAPATLDFDATTLQPWEKQVLAKLVDASRVLHDVYFVQVSPKNPDYLAQLRSQQGAGKDAALDYFDIMVGPWDRLEHMQPFLAVGAKPKGAGFYPPDLTQQELEAWIQAHPADKDAFTGYFTVIQRKDRGLVAVPYSKAYHDKLEEAAGLLREAAKLSRNASLSDFLNKRAAAFLSDDYYASDVAWMDITGSRVEPTIGPYEVYEDELAGYKAAFESFITVADPAAGAELERLKGELPNLERSLPLDDRYKNPNRPFESPIRVVDVAYTAGDARRGVQTTAFNLPNDARVIERKGSKKVMLRNVSQAKFDKVLTPIAQAVLEPALAADIGFKPWFTNVVMHELAHGLGPHAITLRSGEKTTVNKALRDRYSAIEEAKADVTGLHNLTVLQQKGVYDKDFVERAFVSHLADLFRGTRFGAGEAHGMANLIQFNYLWDKGAIRYDPATGKFGGKVDDLIAANRDLARDLLTMEAVGDYAAAGELMQKHGTVRPEMQSALDRLKAIPVDIRPHFAVLEKMKSW
ncbi:MAG TPA: hypothetical protein VFQ38_02775 [Longimicrobiales bacterium]|nr:hypothetical protein [Longimicrobiales bacterium]